MPAVTVENTLVLPRVPAPDATAGPRPVTKVVTSTHQNEGGGFVVARPFPGELSLTGGSGVIAEGDTQWMTAGGGILHDELPQRAGLRSSGSSPVNSPALRGPASPIRPSPTPA